MNDKENKIILYKDDEGRVSVNVRFAEEDVWLTREQLAKIYDTTQQNISQHVINIYADKELTDEATHKKFLLVRQEGSRSVNRNIDHHQNGLKAQYALSPRQSEAPPWVYGIINH